MISIHKNYYKYLFRKLIPITVIASIIFIIANFIHIISVDLSEITTSTYIPYIPYDRRDSAIATITIVSCIYALFFPIYIFSYRFSKKKVDIYYSLPINKGSLALTSFLGGLTSIAISFTISYLLGFFVILAKDHAGVNLALYLPYYFIALILLLLTYMIGSSFALLGNNKTDVAIELILINLLPLLISYTLHNYVSDISRKFDNHISLDVLTPFVGIYSIIQSFGEFISYSYKPTFPLIEFQDCMFENAGNIYSYYTPYLASLILFIILALVLIPAFYYSTKKAKSENAALIQTSYYGVRTFYSILFYTMLTYVTNAVSNKDMMVFLYIAIIYISFIVLDMFRRRKISWTKRLTFEMIASLLYTIFLITFNFTYVTV